MKFLIAALLIFSVNASADLVVFSKINTSRSLEKLGHSRLLFSSPERAYLKSLKKNNLAGARIFSNVTKATLEAKANRLGLKVIVESNENLTLAGESREQWGLDNIGQSQPLAIDDLTTLQIPGVIGEDVGLKSAPAERSDNTVLVAVIDTGIDLNHGDLKEQIARKPDECANLEKYEACLGKAGQQSDPTVKARETTACNDTFSKLDADGNGFPMDCTGWNFTEGRLAKDLIGNPFVQEDPMNGGHGTHVAGIIAAKDNDWGTRGVAQQVRILPIKAVKVAPASPEDKSEFGKNGQQGGTKTTTTADLVARALIYAMKNGARVINISLGWPLLANSELMKEVLDTLQAQQPRPFIVAASGNDSSHSIVLPCAYKDIVCVAAHGPDGSLAEFSNYGGSVDVAAPGVNILSTWPMARIPIRFTDKRGWEFKNGTSMATPFVTGVLARLINQGLSSDEAYARLIAGSRPIPQNPLRHKDMDPKFLVGGNVDLARSLKMSKQPLIVAIQSRPIQLVWDKKQNSIPLTVQVKNEWIAANNTTISARVLAYNGEVIGANLSQSNWTFNQWASKEIKALTTNLLIKDKRIDGEFIIELSIQTIPLKTRTQWVQAEISVPIGPRDPKGETLNIKTAVNPELLPRTIRSVDDQSTRDYLFVSNKADDWKLELLKQQGTEYVLAGQTELKIEAATLVDVVRLDADLDGKADYVAVFQKRLPPKEGSKQQPLPVWEFRFFNGDFSPSKLKTLEHDSQATWIPERYTWMKLGNRLVPAWIAIGFVPDLEKPKFDPWNPDPVIERGPGFYYISEEGLRRAPVHDDDYYYIDTLFATPDQKRKGLVPVLLGKGEGHILDFVVAVVENAKVSEVQELKLPKYRRLAGLTAVDITSLDGKPSDLTLLSGFTTVLTQGLSWLDKTTATTDRIDSPMAYDPIRRIAASYSSPHGKFVFGQSLYDLHFYDIATKQWASTPLKRFSFLPGFIFDRTFYPVVVDDGLPGILVPGGLVSSLAMEIVTPIYENGRLKRLYRPAGLKFEEGAECTELEYFPSLNGKPSQAVFFCGDHFLRVPFKF
jgi:subtilisin family serine protease